VATHDVVRQGKNVVAEGIGLDRADVTILDDVHAALERGTVSAIVGPSGAGKTAFLRCLNRLEEPQRGRVLLDGTDIRQLEPTALRRRVGMIFQTPTLFDGGVRANLSYGLDRVEEKTLVDCLQAAGLDKSFLDRDSSALSVGQAQRVTIARALTRSPEVLLMDEPSSALDKDAAARIESLVVELARRGLTIALVTHNLEQARRVAKTGILLVGGRVRATGDLDVLEAAWPEAEPA
jgi:putative ABC transport system ATP-binding protein